MSDIDILLQQLESERNARKQAESLLQQETEMLDNAKLALADLENSFDKHIEERINRIISLARFFQEDPNPVLRFSVKGELLYFNEASKTLLANIPVSNSESNFWQKNITQAHAGKIIIEQEIYIDQSVLLLLFTSVDNVDYINVYSRDISEIKKIQNQLESSEFKYRYIIDNAGDIFFRINKNGDFTYANQVVERITGYSAAEFTSMNFMQLVREDYRENTFNFYKSQLVNKTELTYLEFPIVTKNGDEIWIGQNVLTNSNSGNELIAVARDITERIKSDEKLSKTSSRLSTLIENLQAGILLVDENRKIVLINQVFCDMFSEKSIKDMHGADGLNWIKSHKHFYKQAEVAIARIMEILEKKERVVAEKVSFENGKIYERDYIPIYSEGSYMGHLWKYLDVTDDIKNDNTLKRNEQKYKTIIEKMGLGLLEIDNENIILWANERFCAMTGYDLEKDLKGKSVSDTLVDENLKPLLEIQNNIAVIPKSALHEIRLKKKNEGYFWLLSSETQLFNENRNVSGKIGIHLDITNQKKTEEALVQAKERAETSTRAKETFLANMSYEVRTPMNAIMGMSSLLGNTAADDKQKSYINTIQLAANNLHGIINDILDFSKIEGGKLLLQTLPFNLHLLLNQLIATLADKVKEKNISINAEIDPKIHRVLIGDGSRLMQVIFNMISNSIKFTNKGGITLQCKLLSDTNNKNEILFKVADTGIGIDAHKLESIFQSFTQEDENTNRKYGGAGLGLSISKHLVNLMGGDILVKSTKGEGSVFEFTLLFSKGAETAAIPEPKLLVEEENLKGVKILLAEDNQINQFLAITILHRWEAEVDIANNGKEAIQLMQKKQYDIVLMDIQMPEMGGIEASQVIREQLKLNTPIMALTANALSGDKEKYLKAGMNDYVSKPFEQKILFNKISGLLKMKEADTANDNGTSKTTHPNEELEQLYDLTQIEEISGGDKSFIRKMITIFIDQIPQLVNRINQGYADKNWNQIKSFAHQMKPSIDTMHIRTLRKEIRLIEEYAEKQVSLDKLPDLIQQLNEVMKKVIDRLQREIN